VLYQLSYMGVPQIIRSNRITQTTKNRFPLTFLSKFQEATGYLTFYGLPTPMRLRNCDNSVNRQFLLFRVVFLQLKIPFPAQHRYSGPRKYAGGNSNLFVDGEKHHCQPLTKKFMETPPSADNPTGKATAGMILGIIGLLAWCIPLFGLPITITGLVLSIKGLKSTSRGMAMAGLIMCIIGLVISIINAAIGAYMGATGRSPFINQLLHH
jgi:hypothetical protein